MASRAGESRKACCEEEEEEEEEAPEEISRYGKVSKEETDKKFGQEKSAKKAKALSSPVVDAVPDRLACLIADITQLEVDAIVNAANEGLRAGGGVCGAIFRLAGPGLEEACRNLAPCPTGQARITPGFALPAKYIIHAVGPIWSGGNEGEPELLAGAYRSALNLADEHKCRSIAFPAISTGIYGYPLQAATDIAVKTAREHLAGQTGITRVVFACFNDKVLGAYRAAGVRCGLR